jgi:small subunit ribosomal protein S20
VANHPSAEKRNRQRVKRTLRNRGVKSAVRTIVKKVHAALEAKDQAQTKETLALAIVALDKAATKGAVHRKSASRKISRMSARLHALGKK